MTGPSSRIVTSSGPEPLAWADACPEAKVGRISMTTISPLVERAVGVGEAVLSETEGSGRATSRRLPSARPLTSCAISAPRESSSARPTIRRGRPFGDRISPVVESKTVTESRTGVPAVMARPSPCDKIWCFVLTICRGWLSLSVGVAPTRPDTSTALNTERGACPSVASSEEGRRNQINPRMSAQIRNNTEKATKI